jgi:hypothetical protein
MVPPDLNGNLPSDFDHRIRGQPEVFTQMRRIALHQHETRRHPFRQSFVIVAGENRFVTNIIGDIRKIDASKLNSLRANKFEIRRLVSGKSSVGVNTP